MYAACHAASLRNAFSDFHAELPFNVYFVKELLLQLKCFLSHLKAARELDRKKMSIFYETLIAVRRSSYQLFRLTL